MTDFVLHHVRKAASRHGTNGGTIDRDTPILGTLDSLAVVELLIKLEEAFGQEYDRSPNLLGNTEVIAPGGPLETVGTLADYLEERARG